MTKKLSILSIVVVLLLSVCLVGCGDDNEPIALEDYPKEIVGTWKLVEYIHKDGRTSDKLDGSETYTFNSDGTCKYVWETKNKIEDGTYELSRTTPEIQTGIGFFERYKWIRISKFTKNHLEISFDGTYVFERE